MILLYLLPIVYIAAVNFYAFRLIRLEYNEWSSGNEQFAVHDGKLFFAALLGGALSIFISMIVMKFRLSNILFMLALPVIAAINIYCFFIMFRSISFIW